MTAFLDFLRARQEAGGLSQHAPPAGVVAADAAISGPLRVTVAATRGDIGAMIDLLERSLDPFEGHGVHRAQDVHRGRILARLDVRDLLLGRARIQTSSGNGRCLSLRRWQRIRGLAPVPFAQ